MKKTGISAKGWIYLLLALLCVGCATQRINWEARVGNYSLDQAIEELGPPDKQAKLSDGTTVAEWLLHRGHREIYPSAGFFAYGPYYYQRAYAPTYLESYAPDYFLRLTFTPDGRLKDWRKLAR